jgi:hypothetical protein
MYGTYSYPCLLYQPLGRYKIPFLFGYTPTYVNQMGETVIAGAPPSLINGYIKQPVFGRQLVGRCCAPKPSILSCFRWTHDTKSSATLRAHDRSSTPWPMGRRCLGGVSTQRPALHRPHGYCASASASSEVSLVRHRDPSARSARISDNSASVSGFSLTAQVHISSLSVAESAVLHGFSDLAHVYCSR